MKLSQAILESQQQELDAPLNITGSFLFISDIEIPLHNASFLNQAITLAHLYGTTQCVWGGDFCHFEAFSPFPGADADVDRELGAIDEYLPGFMEPFKKIYWFMGNHDDRARRALDRKMANKNALRMILSKDTAADFHKKVEVSERFWMDAGPYWRLEHQKNNSTIPVRVAQTLTSKYHRNVITAHTHKCGQSIYNGFWAIDSGCCVDIDKLAYVNLRHSTHTDMQNGAVLMIWRKGQYTPILLTPDRMEFELWRAAN